MKIVKFKAQNIKRLKAVEITPDGALVQITGANGAGKSSVLDAIYFALAGKKAIDKVPVRVGEESAFVELDLGRIIVTRRFDKDGTTSVVVAAEDGARYGSPQTVLDQLLGELSFDPLEFTRMDANERSNALRKLVKLDVDVAALDRENAGDFQHRTEVNRTVARLKPRVDALKARIPAAPPQRVDLTALMAKLREAGEHNARIQLEQVKWEQEDRELDAVKDSHANVLVKIAELERERRRLEDIIKAKEEQCALRPMAAAPVDSRALEAEIDAAAAANRAADEVDRAVHEFHDLEQHLSQYEEEAERLTLAMEARTIRKREAIAKAPMPIEGLSFGDDLEVLYNGVPFEQASSAEQLRVSVAIAMAMNPKLRVLRIKDGSLLDDTNLAAIARMAEALDYQVWIERVETSGKVGIVIEDGAVREPEPAGV